MADDCSGKPALRTRLTEDARIAAPILCGAMYPCSNPELVAAVSEAGGMGIVQPISLTYVHGHEFRAGLRYIRRMTDKPIGMNALIEKSSKIYKDRMRAWVDVALEEGVRFFVTSLGNPRWVVEKAHAHGGKVYHDVTERRWAMKAVEAGVDGLICVNDRAGGHAGALSPESLFRELAELGLPLVCAGGIGEVGDFSRALRMGYAGVQMGTRFIASAECRAHEDYKRAIVAAGEDDIALTERITGVPVAVIRTEYVERVGLKAGPLARWMLQHRKLKHWMRLYYTLNAARELKQASLKGVSYKEFFQAGKSVAGVSRVEPAGEIVRRFVRSVEAE